MDAIEYLTEQHREIESLFAQVVTAARAAPRRRLWRKLIDLLAVHAALEETIFFPAARSLGVEALLPRAFAEHLRLDGIVGEIVEMEPTSAQAAERFSVLEVEKRLHAEQEEDEAFPAVRRILSADELARLGERMESVAEQLLEPGAGVRERMAARRAVA